ncbi:uncharacterized protein LOC144907119 [Branchiostoma floridae x Branchiostoma belcheri]
MDAVLFTVVVGALLLLLVALYVSGMRHLRWIKGLLLSLQGGSYNAERRVSSDHHSLKLLGSEDEQTEEQDDTTTSSPYTERGVPRKIHGSELLINEDEEPDDATTEQEYSEQPQDGTVCNRQVQGHDLEGIIDVTERQGAVSEIGDVTGMQCTAYVTDSTNVRILNVGANSVVHYGMQEEQPPVDDELPTPVLCIVHKPTGPITSLRRRSRDPDPEADCRLLFGVKSDVISNEFMTLTFSENLSNGIVGTDSDDPSHRYLIDVTSISNVSSSDDHCERPSRCQYCPLLPDPSQITLTRNICGFWLRFFGPATTFDVTLGLRVATLRHDETFPESPEPLPSESETIELVDEVTISIETCSSRKRRKNNPEIGVRDRDGDDLITTRWKDVWIHGSKETTDSSFELVPRTMTRTKRTGSLKTKTYGQVLSRLEMLGEEGKCDFTCTGKWAEFDYFSAQLVKTYERKDVDLYLVVVLEQAFAEYYKRNLGAAVTIAKGALRTLKKRPADNSTMLAGRTYYLLSAIYQVARKYGVAERCMEHAQQALSDFEIGEDTGNACYNKGSLYTDMIANDSCPSDRMFDEVRESLELAICHWRKDPSGCVAHQRRAHTKLASALLVCDSQQGRARTVNPRNVEAARRSIETVRKELWQGMPKRGRCRFLLTESDLYYREKGFTLSQEKAEEAKNLANECGFKLEADMAKQRLANLVSCQRAILTPTTSQLLKGVALADSNSASSMAGPINSSSEQQS